MRSLTAPDPIEPGISSNCKTPGAVQTSGFPHPGSNDRNTRTFPKAKIEPRVTCSNNYVLLLFHIFLHRSGRQSLTLFIEAQHCVQRQSFGFCLFMYVSIYLGIRLQFLYLHYLKLKTLKICPWSNITLREWLL